MKVAVIIPVYGQQHLTDALMTDIGAERARVDVFVVDNGGDYVAQGWEEVLRPGENLRWLKGSNLGLSHAARVAGYDGYVLLNNDTRLSPSFFGELIASWRELPDTGILAPLYDDFCAQQQCEYRGPANGYEAIARHRTVNWVDGTCLFIPATTVAKVGILDETRFAPWGWGAELDYYMRVRSAGLQIYVSERAYLNHFHEKTVRNVVRDYRAYEDEAWAVMEAGMAEKWGVDWRERLGPPAFGKRVPRVAPSRGIVRRALGKARRTARPLFRLFAKRER